MTNRQCATGIATATRPGRANGDPRGNAMCPITASIARPADPADPTSPRPDFSLTFPPDPGWVRTAREAIRAVLRTAGRSDLVDTALLLTSEVVTNAVTACLSSGCVSPLKLHAAWSPTGALHVLVRDDAPGLPVQRVPAGDAEHGRGLLLIGACAADWGICRHGPGPGKAVWFELGD
ncbi:ATP-binding protein [Streptomyces sp. H27-D2]|uniref:ATP-binding protein n=1 Tax=Streptomyces sp. H27-D2 TaxID=3046304 RepID=UPI002DB6E448|nr:ATP-binding protein [Streptomyces sp. H27-D2]MEC4015708.1 ATP-binding protein [Streptomyces sp. H27-D2]